MLKNTLNGMTLTFFIGHHVINITHVHLIGFRIFISFLDSNKKHMPKINMINFKNVFQVFLYQNFIFFA